MNTYALMSSMSRWLVARYQTTVNGSSSEREHTLQFVVTTTKSRASSIVSRVTNIANNVFVNRKFEVGKELLGPPPANRAALAEYKIYLKVTETR